MNDNVKKVVLLMEQHTAEGMKNDFNNNVGNAIVGHGLGLIGLFGIAIQEIAKPSSSAGSFAILATLVITSLSLQVNTNNTHMTHTLSCRVL